MPYIRKGKCVFKKSTGKKVGCSKSIAKAKNYLKALHVNVENEETFNEAVARVLSLYRGS